MQKRIGDSVINVPRPHSWPAHFMHGRESDVAYSGELSHRSVKTMASAIRGMAIIVASAFIFLSASSTFAEPYSEADANHVYRARAPLYE